MEVVEDFDTLVEMSQLTTSALKNGLQMVFDLHYRFFEVQFLLDRCMKCKYELDSLIALYQEVYKNMQKFAEQSTVISFFTESSVSRSAMHFRSLEHSDNRKH
jgi:GTP1/Obg family GTP-binding protein